MYRKVLSMGIFAGALAMMLISNASVSAKYEPKDNLTKAEDHIGIAFFNLGRDKDLDWDYYKE